MSDAELGTATGHDAPDEPAPYARDAAAVVAGLGSDPSNGLTTAEAASRLTRNGSNQITAEKPPAVWAVASLQLRDPMNLMLVAVTVVSFLIGEVSTGIIVGLLIVLNVVLGSRQELKARASVDALSQMQVPQARVVRGGQLAEVPAVDLVPGDIVQLEAGDIVPAGGRIVHSATLEAQEAALTGESAPVAKDAGVLPSGEVALGDRANMLFQNTSVTRGTASVVVTATGVGTQMGQIATMAKKTKKEKKQQEPPAEVPVSPSAERHDAETGPPAKMKKKDYEREMQRLHGELVAMQEWVKATGAKVCVVFEGRDTAGKGGTIKRIVERVSPREFRVVALSAPTEREKSQMYIQRYLPHFPAAGEVVIFERSWYNRAGVEPVMGFWAPKQTEQFLEMAPTFEKVMVESGIILLKYWHEVGPDEQTRRLGSRIHDPRKLWKLTAMDLKSYSRWYDYSRARDVMFVATDTAWAPWYIAHTDVKKRGRLNIISHLLSQVPYEPLPDRDITLPRRQRAGQYQEPNLPLRHIPTPF